MRWLPLVGVGGLTLVMIRGTVRIWRQLGRS